MAVRVEPRSNSRPFRCGCGRRGPAYDRPGERRLDIAPLWGIVVFLAYRMRRVDCRRCGVTAETVPWCDGKNQLTTTYRRYLAAWVKLPRRGEAAPVFRTSRDSARRAVAHAVEWGLTRRDLSGLTALGNDEVAWGRGHTYLTLVYGIEAGRGRPGPEDPEDAINDRSPSALRSSHGGMGRGKKVMDQFPFTVRESMPCQVAEPPGCVF
jgi:transposase